MIWKNESSEECSEIQRVGLNLGWSSDDDLWSEPKFGTLFRWRWFFLSKSQTLFRWRPLLSRVKVWSTLQTETLLSRVKVLNTLFRQRSLFRAKVPDTLQMETLLFRVKVLNTLFKWRHLCQSQSPEYTLQTKVTFQSQSLKHSSNDRHSYLKSITLNRKYIF